MEAEAREALARVERAFETVVAVAEVTVAYSAAAMVAHRAGVAIVACNVVDGRLDACAALDVADATVTTVSEHRAVDR